jgi:hypothetical protein
MANINSLKGLVLSANDLRHLTDWPEALIEDYLTIFNNLVTLADLSEWLTGSDLQPVVNDGDGTSSLNDDALEFYIQAAT